MFGFLAGGAVLGVLATMWGKIKGVAWRLAGMFVQRVEIPTEPGHEAVVAYLVTKYRRSRNYDRMYGASWEYQRDGRYGLVPYEQFGTRSLILWSGWFPFLFSNQVEAKASSGKGNSDGSSTGAAKVYSTITSVRGTIDVEAIVRAACDARNAVSWATEDHQAATKNRFCIHHVPARGGSDGDDHGGSDGLAWYQQGNYRLLAHTPDQLGKARTHGGSALDHLIFPRRVKDLITEIGRWRKSKDWYAEKGIAWKRGWLLYGPPGTGKTALARAFAEDLNMPIYVYNLAEMGNFELIKAWTEMQTNTPCIALIEDIDNVFHGRENVVRRPAMLSMMMAQPKDGDDRDGKGRGPLAPPLTFDCLLNCLDGVERADGIFTIVTTNDITKIDPALGQPRTLPDGTTEFISTRPGRVDKAVELSYMEVADKRRMAEKILGAYEAEHREMLRFVDQFPDLQETPAQFQERCAQVALRCYWRDAGEPAAEEKPYFARLVHQLMAANGSN